MTLTLPLKLTADKQNDSERKSGQWTGKLPAYVDAKKNGQNL